MKIPAHFCDVQAEPQLREAIVGWLKQIPLDQLPRLTFGQIEPDSLEISILSIKRGDQETEVVLQIWFKETMTGSSCGFEASPEAGYAEVVLAMDCASVTAQFR
jgi:hypothetical protein